MAVTKCSHSHPERGPSKRNIKLEGPPRELFICHACHKSIQLECLQATRTVKRQEQEDILNLEGNWRCADCVASGTFRLSAILEEFAKIHGKERTLLIRWSGYDMTEDSLTSKNHLETDYTGLQAQLTRRRMERRRCCQDQYGKSILACKTAPEGVKKVRRLDTLALDPVQGRWKKGAGDDQTYHEWHMAHPAIRRALEFPHQKERKPAVYMIARDRDCKAVEQLTLVVRGLTDLIKESLIWKWFHAFLRMSNTNRALTCFGLGAEVQSFAEAAQQELSWPCQPVSEWLKERITTEP